MPSTLNSRLAKSRHSLNASARFTVSDVLRATMEYSTKISSMARPEMSLMTGSTAGTIIGSMTGTIITTGLIRQLVIG